MSVYTNPEAFGLTKIAEADWAGSYEYNIFVVFFHQEEERYYWASDKGCSCPMPFEDFTSLGSLSSGEYKEVREAARRSFDSACNNPSPMQLGHLVTKIQEHRQKRGDRTRSCAATCRTRSKNA